MHREDGLRRANRALSATAAIFLGLVVGGVAATWAVPHDALAATDCFTYHDHEQVDTSGSNGTAHYGTRTASPGMYIEGHDDEPPVCIHTSSVLSQSPNDSWIEIGWVKAKSGVGIGGNCIDTGSGNPSVGDGNPELFRARSKDGGATWTCTVFWDITTVDQPESFEVVDSDTSQMVWDTRFNGGSIGSTIDMPFSASTSVVNGERYTPNNAAYPTGESAAAAFNGLLYFTQSSGWHNWVSASCGRYMTSDDDPTYHVNNWTSDPTYILVAPGLPYC